MISSLLLQMNGAMGGWWAFAFLGPVVGLLVMGTIGYLLWTATSGGRSAAPRSTQTKQAIETLRERYARGEIDEETFEKRSRKLQK